MKKRSLLERVLHWGLSFSIFAVWFYLEDGDAPHRYFGYFALVVSAVQFGLSLGKKSRSELLSDHPIAAYSVHLSIWSVSALLALSGWMMGLDKFWGEEWLEETHNLLSWALMGFVVLHLVGVLRDALKHKRATWMHMVTGLKD